MNLQSRIPQHLASALTTPSTSALDSVNAKEEAEVEAEAKADSDSDEKANSLVCQHWICQCFRLSVPLNTKTCSFVVYAPHLVRAIR